MVVLIAKRVSIVTLLTGVNLAATLLNQIVLAYLFGAGASMDAFLACGAVPFVILNLAIGDLGYVLVPLLMHFEKKGEAEAAVNSSFTAVGVLSVAVTTFGMLTHRWILHMTTAANMPAHTFDLAVTIAPLVWVVIGLTIMGSYLTGIHYYRRQFTFPSATLAIPYLGMIAGGLAGVRQMGIMAVVVGWAAGTLLRDVVLFLALHGTGIRLSRNILHPATMKLIKAIPPLGISLLPFTALPMIDVYWASRLPVGSISYLGFSARIVIAVTSIVVQGLSIVMFPDLSEDVASGQLDAFRRKVIEALKIIFLAIVPLAMFVAVVRLPMLEIALQRGKFTAESSLGVARVLPLYLLGVIWMAMMNIVIRSFYALQDYMTPAKVGVSAITLYAAMSGLLIHRFSYLGIGIAYSVFWFLMFLVQSHFLGKAVGGLLDRDLLEFLGKVLASSVLAIGVMAALVSELRGSIQSTAGLLAQGMCGVAIFILVSHFMFRLPQYPVLLGVIHRRMSPRQAG